MPFARPVLASVVVLAAAALVPGDPAADARKAAHRPQMCYRDNGVIKLGIDLNLGGAITHLSRSGTGDNVVNNWDWGRQIQMSHYAGPSPFKVPGKEPAKAWAAFPWNPVQAGDHFGHASRVLAAGNAAELVVTCRPTQWAHDDVPAECTFETRVTLDGPTARVRCKLVNGRADETQYAALAQELPAVYVNGPYHRLTAYTGDAPFTGGAPTRVAKKPGESPGFPWARFHATERWAAQVNDADWGLGVYQPAAVEFLGGFAGEPGAGGTKDGPTGYIAPVRAEILDHDIVYEYEYTLILGPLADIRRRATALHGKPTPPSFTFAADRRGWTLEGATDAGWPLRNEWDIRPKKGGAHLVGPVGFWRAEAAPVLTIGAAFTTPSKQGRVFWATHAEPNFAAARSLPFPIVGDGAFHTTVVRLADAPTYRGGILRLRIDPGDAGGAGERVRVSSIALGEK